MGKYPTLRSLIIIFISGSFGYFFELPFYVIISIAVFSIILSLTKSSLLVKYLLLNIGIGFLLSGFITNDTIDYPDKIIPSFKAISLGKVEKVLTDKKNYARVLINGKIDTKFINKPVDTRLLVVIFKESEDTNYLPGDKLIMNLTLEVPEKKQLKSDFPERQYLKSLEAQFQGITNSKDVFIKSRDTTLFTHLYLIKKELQSKIDFSFSENIAPIVKGLLTGDRNFIDKEVKESFAKTGTAHVLAISGLHIGLIALLVYTIIGFIKNRYLKLIIFNLLVWSFIIFTGLHDSAIRAGIMATLYVALITFGRGPDKFNILFSTVFIFLLFDPESIFSVSFLLSVSAVLGIFLFYEKIYYVLMKAIKVDNFITKFISASIAISISATMLSVLFSAYYFNIFNVIYPISNLLIVPLISLSTVFGIFYLISMPIKLISNLFAESMEFLIQIVLDFNNYLMQYEELFLTTSNTLTIAILSTIVLIYILAAYRIKRKLITRFSISTVFLILSLFLLKDFTSDNKIKILQREQFTALIEEKGSRVSVLVIDRKKYDFLKGDYSLVNYLKEFETVNFYKTGMVSIDIHDRIKYDVETTDKFLSIKEINNILKTFNQAKLYNKIEY